MNTRLGEGTVKSVETKKLATWWLILSNNGPMRRQCVLCSVGIGWLIIYIDYTRVELIAHMVN